jgi:hypothetical protein
VLWLEDLPRIGRLTRTRHIKSAATRTKMTTPASCVIMPIIMTAQQDWVSSILGVDLMRCGVTSSTSVGPFPRVGCRGHCPSVRLHNEGSQIQCDKNNQHYDDTMITSVPQPKNGRLALTPPGSEQAVFRSYSSDNSA